MANPLPLQLANTVCYVGDFSSLPDHLVSDSGSMGRTNIKCQNGPVLSPAQVFYFNGKALNEDDT
jgi:hypothetical protein